MHHTLTYNSTHSHTSHAPAYPHQPLVERDIFITQCVMKVPGQIDGFNNFCTDRILCKTLDISATASSTQENADLKFQRGGSKWQQLSYAYNISLNFWLPKDKTSQSLYKTIIVRQAGQLLEELQMELLSA